MEFIKVCVTISCFLGITTAIYSFYRIELFLSSVLTAILVFQRNRKKAVELFL